MLKVAFVGGNAGTWSVESIKAVAGDGLPAVSRLAVLESADRFTELGGEWGASRRDELRALCHNTSISPSPNFDQS